MQPNHATTTTMDQHLPAFSVAKGTYLCINSTLSSSNNDNPVLGLKNYKYCT
jgi:hypothetical protein